MTARWYMVPLAGLLLAGCAPQFDRIETGVLRNGQEIERLQREQQLLRQEVEGISSLLRLDQDAGKQADARGTARLGLLSQRIDQLIQKLDDNAAFMRNLSARVDLLATRAGIPTLGEFKEPPAGGAGAPASGILEESDLPEEGRAIFQSALRDRARGNTELARQGFREFLGRYPQSELADDALYWLGELDYGEQRYREALASFEDMLRRYPQSELAPAVLLKSGICLLETGQTQAGRQRLEQLIAGHPDTEEATLARARLGGVR